MCETEPIRQDTIRQHDTQDWKSFCLPRMQLCIRHDRTGRMGTCTQASSHTHPEGVETCDRSSRTITLCAKAVEGMDRSERHVDPELCTKPHGYRQKTGALVIQTR